MKRFNDEVFEEVKNRIESCRYEYQKYEDALFFGFKRLGDSTMYDKLYHCTYYVMDDVKTDDLDYSNPQLDKKIENARIKAAYFAWGNKRMANLHPALPLICKDCDYDYRYLLPFMAKQFLKDESLSSFHVVCFLLVLKLVSHHSMIHGCGEETYINEDFKEEWEV